MHTLRRRVLMSAVDALIAGRRLTLIDLARSWLGADRVRAPLKAMDRLLSNEHLHAERERVYAGMARWLLRCQQPVIIVDWSELKNDKSWHMLRAAVAVGGRTLTILDQVFPGGLQGSPQAERQFLQRLKQILPAQARPILVTDAGFRTPWFRAVTAMGWRWVGRLRHRTYVKPIEAPATPEQWLPCKALYALVRKVPRDLGLMHTLPKQCWVCRMIVHGRPPKGRKHHTLQGLSVRSSHSRKQARREREPWLLVVSPELSDLSAQQLVNLYAKRMQIELSFRDLKSHRYGQGFEDSLTHKRHRLEILLLINALAAFASWLIGMACEAAGIDRWLSPWRSHRRLYSILRLGREALSRQWLRVPIDELLARLRHPSAYVLDQIGVAR